MCANEQCARGAPECQQNGLRTCLVVTMYISKSVSAMARRKGSATPSYIQFSCNQPCTHQQWRAAHRSTIDCSGTVQHSAKSCKCVRQDVAALTRKRVPGASIETGCHRMVPRRAACVPASRAASSHHARSRRAALALLDLASTAAFSQAVYRASFAKWHLAPLPPKAPSLARCSRNLGDTISDCSAQAASGMQV